MFDKLVKRIEKRYNSQYYNEELKKSLRECVAKDKNVGDDAGEEDRKNGENVNDEYKDDDEKYYDGFDDEKFRVFREYDSDFRQRLPSQRTSL